MNINLDEITPKKWLIISVVAWIATFWVVSGIEDMSSGRHVFYTVVLFLWLLSNLVAALGIFTG